MCRPWLELVELLGSWNVGVCVCLSLCAGHTRPLWCAEALRIDRRHSCSGDLESVLALANISAASCTVCTFESLPHLIACGTYSAWDSAFLPQSTPTHETKLYWLFKYSSFIPDNDSEQSQPVAVELNHENDILIFILRYMKYLKRDNIKYLLLPLYSSEILNFQLFPVISTL